MKYGKEVIGLLGAHPTRFFKMRHIVNHIDPNAVGRDRLRIRVGVLRVLQQLQDNGSVRVKATGSQGTGSLYKWKSDT